MCQEAGWRPCPIPPELAPDVRDRGEWWFGTNRHPNPAGMYLFDPVLKLMTQSTTDRFAVSHGGHGVNSYALTYLLMWGPLAVATQHGWGGVYMDDRLQASLIDSAFASVGQLVDAVRSAPALRSRPGRLVVAVSDLEGSGAWGWLDRSVKDDKHTSWFAEHRDDSALSSACAWIANEAARHRDDRNREA